MYLSPNENRDIYFEMVTSLLTQLLLSFHESNLTALATDTPETATFHHAVEIISSHLEDNLSVDEIARECNVSVTQLKRIFRKLCFLRCFYHLGWYYHSSRGKLKK